MRLPPLLTGMLAMLMIAVTTIVVWIPLAWWIICRLFVRGAARSRLQRKMDKIIWWWTGHNRWMLRKLNITEPEINWQQQDEVSPDNWYLVICNHQSWTDIMLLQSYLYGVIPPLKFFTKEQLIWVPGIGVAMYVLGFPYVKRATKAQIKANPKLRNADRENTAAACEGFKNHPTTVLNFIEGTRRTEEKANRQGSEYQHLLRPKIGGLDYVLEGMEGHLHKLLDVTIVYPDGVPQFWDFLQGKCRRVIFEVTPHDIPYAELADADGNRRAHVAQWIKSIWTAKDARISELLGVPHTAATASNGQSDPAA
ncbi:MAG: acetyltransferase [Pseudomonadota bacterium]